MRSVIQGAAANISEPKIPAVKFNTASINHKLSEKYKMPKSIVILNKAFLGMRANGSDDLKNNTGNALLANHLKSTENHKIV